MPLYTTVITSKQIEDSPDQTLDQLLRQIPGINLTGAPFYTTDPTGNQIKMRGLTNAKVLMLLDGVPMLDPFYTTVQWFKVPPSSVDHIEVIRGGNSSLWGNMAVAGVVNVVSKKPTVNSGDVMLSGGSMQTYNGSAFKNFVLSDAVSMTASADFLNSGGYQTTPNQYLNQFPARAIRPHATITRASQPISSRRPTLAPISAADTTMRIRTSGVRVRDEPAEGTDVAMGLTKSYDDRSQLSANAWWQHIGFDKSNGAGCYLQSPTNCNTTSATSPLVQYANSHDWRSLQRTG